MAVQVSSLSNCEQCKLCTKYMICRLGHGDETPALTFGWDYYTLTILCESFEFRSEVLENKEVKDE